jgi:hypothetical protein
MSARLTRFAVAATLVIAAQPVAASDLVIYDDASENGFNPACSFNATPDFAETTTTHDGSSDAISFDAASFGAISWCTPTSLSTTDYSGITFWVNGGASGGQDLELVVGLTGTPVASASLDALLGGPIPAGTWTQITASFDSGLMQYGGNFDQISIQDNSGNDPAHPQPTVYFDDVSLIGRVSATDEIFKSGFEAVTTTATIVIDQSVTACTGNLLAERYTWKDSGGWTRSATLSHNDTNQNGGHEGELCDYTYHTDAVTVRDVQELVSGGAGGFGYIVSHLVYLSAAYNAAISHDGDDSPLGHGFKGTFTSLLNGRHHAILRFQLNYPRWGVPASNTPTKYNVPVTIDWLIATGRDHPLWSVSYDLSAAPDKAIEADSRAPYGDMAFDGAGSAAGYGNNVGGVAWGDHYKFTTTGAAPMTLNSSWTWNQPNTIPYVYLWTQAPAPDAEMGIVQSEDIGKQDAGSEFSYPFWTETSATTTGCPGNYLMPCVDYQWAYQANADDADVTAQGDKHLTWGTGYGFQGDSAYEGNDPATTHVGWPRQSYATYVVLGLHSASVTSAQVAQVENTMDSALSASIGSVLTSGPAGVNRSDTRQYQPAGYNRVYGTWDVDVQLSGNAAITLNAAGSLMNPIFVLHHHSSALPGSVTYDGNAQTADVDYFATVDTSDATDTRLWITVNRDWTGSHSLTVQ